MAVDGERFILRFAVPLDVNIHKVSSSLEALELDVGISEGVRTHFLLPVANNFKVIRIQVVTIKLGWVSDSAETDINPSGVVIQVKIHAVGFLCSAALLSYRKRGEAVAVLLDGKLDQGVASV